jgi:hypothetical protein
VKASMDSFHCSLEHAFNWVEACSSVIFSFEQDLSENRYPVFRIMLWMRRRTSLWKRKVPEAAKPPGPVLTPD